MHLTQTFTPGPKTITRIAEYSLIGITKTGEITEDITDPTTTPILRACLRTDKWINIITDGNKWSEIYPTTTFANDIPLAAITYAIQWNYSTAQNYQLTITDRKLIQHILKVCIKTCA